MRKARLFIAPLLAFWLAFGPAASALAQSAAAPCESMEMSMPADDCCSAGTDQASCLSACMPASPAMTGPAEQLAVPVAGHGVVVASAVRRNGILAPPDIAPPKSFVS